METNPNDAPRRTRRADRYKQESGVAPSTELMQRAAGLNPPLVPEPVSNEPLRDDATQPPPNSHPAESADVANVPLSDSILPRQSASPMMNRARRSAAYSASARSAPQQEATISAPPGMKRPRKPSADASAPTTMERPARTPHAKAKKQQRKPAFRMPWYVTTALIAAVVTVIGLFTAQTLMSAYLTRQEEARQAAYQQVVDNHPIYFKDLIEQYADENNLRPAFVAAIILNESSFRTDAESGVGARGLMQLMPDTASWIAGKMDISSYTFDRMYDAETNIRFGTWYLGYLAKLFRGDPVLVSCAYHAGQGEVTGWLSDPSLSADGVTLDIANMQDGPTKTYAGRVTEAYGIYEALYYDETADNTAAGTVPDSILAAR